MVTQTGVRLSSSAWQMFVCGLIFLLASNWMAAGEVAFVSDPAASVRPRIRSIEQQLSKLDKKIEAARQQQRDLERKLADLQGSLAEAETAIEAPAVAAPTEGTVASPAEEEAPVPATPTEAEPAAPAPAEPAPAKGGLWSRLFGKTATPETTESIAQRIASTEQELARTTNDLAGLEASRIPIQAELDKEQAVATYLTSKVGASLAESLLNEYQASLEPLRNELASARESVAVKTRALGDLRQTDASLSEIAAAQAELRAAEKTVAQTYETLDRNTYGIKVCIREIEQFNRDAEMSHQKMAGFGVDGSQLPTVTQLVDAEMAARAALAKAQTEQSTSSVVLNAIAWPFVKIGEGVAGGYRWVAEKVSGD